MIRCLRILIVSQQFRPLVGGYERAAERLATELARQGHDVTVVSERRERAWPAQEARDGYGLRRLWCFYRPRWHMVTSLLSYLVFLVFRGWRFDVIHIQQYGAHAALAVAMGRLLSRVVVLRTTSTRAQGIGTVLGGNGPGARLVAHLHRQVDACIATTSWAVEEVTRFGISSDRVALIPNGIDTSEFVPGSGLEGAPAKWRPGIPGALMVLFCGRLEDAKNPTGLVDAWRHVQQVVPQAVLVLVGDGALRKAVEEKVRVSGLGDVVVMAGEQSTVLPWYQAADVFVLPSHHEGLSNALLEAMSCGLPVVSTMVSGSADIFAECDVGELVETGNGAALAEGIERLLLDPERRSACGARARQYVEGQFSIESVARQTAALYQRLLGQGI